MIMILGLLLFGPRKLPQMGRTIGKAFSEFRRATTDFKMNLEREIRASEVREAVDDVDKTVREVRGAVRRELNLEPDKVEPNDAPDKH
jgi:TatA/E family protein of Tat protein translocase